MSFLPYLVFAAMALAAIAFIAVPLGRLAEAGPKKARALLAGAGALFLLGVGGGAYLMLGNPHLALRASQPVDKSDINRLVDLLIQRVKKTPDDPVAWSFLGRGYLAAKDPGDGAKAYARAIQVLRKRGQNDATLDSAYGEALLQQSGGAMTAEAESAFAAAVAANPKDIAGRFFLGQAKAMRGDRAGARQLWEGLLAEAPTGSPLHQIVVDRLALLTGASGQAPDINAMVSGLAARLKADPHDGEGWQRLIRAYTVLGDKDKAKAALATARKTFAGDAATLAPINDEAKELNLD